MTKMKYKKYIVWFNQGAFYRIVKAPNANKAFEKAFKSLTDKQKIKYEEHETRII